MEAQLCPIACPDDDTAATTLARWRSRYAYYYAKLEAYLRFVIPRGESVLMCGCQDGALLEALEPSRGFGVDCREDMVALARRNHPQFDYHSCPYHQFDAPGCFEYVILNDMAGEVQDLIVFMKKLAGLCTPTGRVVILQHNYLWRPALKLAGALGLKQPEQPQNWLSTGDISMFLYAAGLETVQVHNKLFAPLRLLGIGQVINALMGLVPVVNRLASTQIIVARLLPDQAAGAPHPSCTICLTTRDERENIEPMVRAIPQVGRNTEILFVEGHSVDGTRQEIRRVMEEYPERDIRLVVQEGTGQGDAIRSGFHEARGDIIVLLEADQTSPAEDVLKAWELIVSGRADYVNGSRFIYPLARGAMGRRNLLGNILFALWFTWFLGQRTSDVLCGIKAISKRQYDKLYRNWGFLEVDDPFGDFELIFGASRLGLKISELPTPYYPRQHGRSKTRPLRHGLMLAKMVLAATVNFKCR